MAIREDLELEYVSLTNEREDQDSEGMKENETQLREGQRVSKIAIIYAQITVVCYTDKLA